MESDTQTAKYTENIVVDDGSIDVMHEDYEE